MTEITVVEFLVRFGSYNPGDVAGFPDAHAKQLLAAGVAVPFVKDPAPVVEPKRALPPRRASKNIVTKG
jgi:hypothetical protein